MGGPLRTQKHTNAHRRTQSHAHLLVALNELQARLQQRQVRLAAQGARAAAHRAQALVGQWGSLGAHCGRAGEEGRSSGPAGCVQLFPGMCRHSTLEVLAGGKGRHM